MKRTKYQDNFYISPLTGKKIFIPEKKENETYTESSYRQALEATKKAIDTGVASFCSGDNFTSDKNPIGQKIVEKAEKNIQEAKKRGVSIF